jgi:hypothetical protein
VVLPSLKSEHISSSAIGGREKEEEKRSERDAHAKLGWVIRKEEKAASEVKDEGNIELHFETLTFD